MRRMRLSSNSRPRGRELCVFLTTFVTSSLCLKGNASMLQTSWKEPDGQTSAGGGFHEVHDIPPNKLCFFHMENSMYTSQGLSSIHEVHHWKMVSGQDSTQHRILKVLKLRKKVRCLNWFSFRVTCVWLQTFACDHVSYLVFFRRYRKHAHTHTHCTSVIDSGQTVLTGQDPRMSPTLCCWFANIWNEFVSDWVALIDSPDLNISCHLLVFDPTLDLFSSRQKDLQLPQQLLARLNDEDVTDPEADASLVMCRDSENILTGHDKQDNCHLYCRWFVLLRMWHEFNAYGAFGLLSCAFSSKLRGVDGSQRERAGWADDRIEDWTKRTVSEGSEEAMSRACDHLIICRAFFVQFWFIWLIVFLFLCFDFVCCTGWKPLKLLNLALLCLFPDHSEGLALVKS